MFQGWKWPLLAACIWGATNVQADEDGSFVSYEAIVSELKANADDVVPAPRNDLNWDEVALHGGMSLATSFISIDAPNGAHGDGMLKGFEIFSGANLFSKQARAEIGFRSFAPEDLGRINVDLKELEARMIFLPTLYDRTLLRMGLGLTLRYMDLDSRKDNASTHSKATTPASSLILGIEHKISKAVSVGPDFAYRSALNDSFDKSAWDAAIRLNATF